MNEATVRESARERLLDAELCEVLDAALPADAVLPDAEPARRRAWLGQAAMVLFGISIAIGAFALSGPSLIVGQDPVATDHMETPWERWRVAFQACQEVSDAGDLASLPPQTSGLRLHCEELPEDVLQEGLERVSSAGGPTTLALYGDATDIPWASLGPAAQVRQLSVMNAKLDATAIRRLRHLPHLEALYVPVQRLDIQVAQALCELPKLTTLIVEGHATEAGVEALRSSLHLRHLALEIPPPGTGERLGVRSLDRLRAVSLTGIGAVFDDATARSLAEVEDLRTVDLGTIYNLVGTALPLLPRTLESLTLRTTTHVLPAHLMALAKIESLRHLAFAGKTPEHMWSARAALVGALQLERFELQHSAPDPALWQALQRDPTVRRLSFASKAEDLAASLEQCARIPSIEQLDISVTELPRTDVFAPLLQLDSLARVRIQMDCGDPRIATPSADSVRRFVDSLQRELGTAIQVEFRSF